MSEVDHGIPRGINLVEDIVPEDLQEITLASLGPLSVMLIFGPLIDKVQFGHQAHQTSVLKLATQIRRELIIQMKGGVKGRHQLGGDASDEEVDSAVLVFLQPVQQPKDRILQLRAVCASEMLHRLGGVVHDIRRIGTQSDDHLPEID